MLVWEASLDAWDPRLEASILLPELSTEVFRSNPSLGAPGGQEVVRSVESAGQRLSGRASSGEVAEAGRLVRLPSVGMGCDKDT